MYFAEKDAVDYNGKKTVNEVVETIVKRHMRTNPPMEYNLVYQLCNNIETDESSRTDINFNKIYPNAKIGDLAYASSYVEAENESSVIFFCDLSSDTVIFLNGEEIGKTIDCDEALGDVRKIYADLKKGRNDLVLRCRKTSLGFGAKIGRVSHRGEPFWFKTDLHDINGVLGWSYSTLCKTEDVNKIEWCTLSGLDTSFEKVFEGQKGVCYAVTFVDSQQTEAMHFRLRTNSVCSIFVNGEQIITTSCDSDFTALCCKGENYIVAEIECDKKSSFELKIMQNEASKGNSDKFLYTGPLKKRDENIIKEFKKPYLPGGCDYWRISNAVRLRLSEGKSLFGRWSYPLGVSLRGMLQWAKKTDNQEIFSYIDSYIKTLTDVYEYAKWDAKQYTVSLVLRQQSIIEMLDDFGSFESALIDIAIDKPDKTLDEIIARGAAFIKDILPRLENGTMYRKALLPLHRNINHNHLTMWADDLYMGGCFMCRYYEYSGDESFLDDAALQFRKYFEYLFIEEKKLMSHVYSLRRSAVTNVAWGRGNGWVLFSLTELLRIMPKNHKAYDDTVKMFRTLCEGVLSYQDQNGMWHQVINDNESFAETSCTAMFGCAFLRGIKNGWIEKENYFDAAMRAWRALTKYSIDSGGNIYGICKGSGFSFRESYYKKELPWVFNDTHGMGIILLFGAEALEAAY